MVGKRNNIQTPRFGALQHIEKSYFRLLEIARGRGVEVQVNRTPLRRCVCSFFIHFVFNS
jgi:hypothetical protein